MTTTGWGAKTSVKAGTMPATPTANGSGNRDSNDSEARGGALSLSDTGQYNERRRQQ